jgi:hypothetical protein
MGGVVSASLWMFDSVVVLGPEGVVETAPAPAEVYAGMGLRKASRKAGVPKVSVRAIPRT